MDTEVDPDGPRATRTRSTSVVPLGDDTYRIESRLTDMSYNGNYGPEALADQAVIHDIELTAVVRGPSLEVVSLTPQSVNLPYETCPFVLPMLNRLVGAGLASGWRRAVLDVSGGTRGCTHVNTVLLGLAEMLPLVYFLTMNERTEHSAATRASGRWIATGLAVAPGLAGACHSLRDDGPVVTTARANRI